LIDINGNSGQQLKTGIEGIIPGKRKLNSYLALYNAGIVKRSAAKPFCIFTIVVY